MGGRLNLVDSFGVRSIFGMRKLPASVKYSSCRNGHPTELNLEIVSIFLSSAWDPTAPSAECPFSAHGKINGSEGSGMPLSFLTIGHHVRYPYRHRFKEDATYVSAEYLPSAEAAQLIG